MIEDFDGLVNDCTLETDLCIVGSGAAGLALAREFLGTRTEVVILESGGLSPEESTQELYRGEVAGRPFRGLQSGRARQYGGTTNLWGGQCLPLDAIDFERRPWVPYSGWPLSGADLAPYYERAKARLLIQRDELESSIWQRFGLRPLAFDPALLTIAHGVFIPQHNLGQRYRNEIAAAPNIRMMLHATVVRLQANRYGRRVEYTAVRTLGGRRGRIKARAFALCAGTIENTRLLLLSDDINRKGLGNDNELVGRFLQDHPFGRCATVSTNAPRLLQDHFNMLYDKGARTLRHGHGSKYLPKMALTEAIQRREGLLNCVGRLEYEYEPESAMQAVRDLVVSAHMGQRPTNFLAKLAAIGLGSPALASNAWRFALRGLTPAIKPRSIHLEIFSEQAPDPESRITLGSQIDAMGLRQVRIAWRLGELDRRTWSTFARTVQAEFQRLGLGHVQPAGWLQPGCLPGAEVLDSYHPAGTLRMAQSAKNGVVDADSKVFGVDGIYIAGSAVFPTSGAANPVFTITAMTLRLAEHLKSVLSDRQRLLPRVHAVAAR